MARTDIHDMSSLLRVLHDKVERDEANGDGKHISVREVLDLIGRRAYGPLLLLVGLISVSPAALIPGSTWALALLTVLIAAQLLFLRKTPWLPSAATKIKLSEPQLGRFTTMARPTANFLDTIIRPRLQFMADPPWVIGVALLVILSALITFPLGLIPLAPLAPGLAIVLFGLGLTARDGVLLLVGAAVVSGAFWLLLARVM